MSLRFCILLFVLEIIQVGLVSSRGQADDYFLTIGGGYSPSGNQASLENNVLFFQRVVRESGVSPAKSDVYFSDGDAPGKDLQVIDPTSVPKANRLMAEFFGDDTSLGLSYRNHRIPNVRGNTKPENIRKWFKDFGSTMKADDRLLIYVTAHGNRSSNRQTPYNTTIATWNKTSIKMKEFVAMLDKLPSGVEVVVIMVQCHAGGFARFIFQDGDPDKGLSSQRRYGFFATVHDRPAAGCTPEVDEASYVEYSTYFWAAIGGRTRDGKRVDAPDYDRDGTVSFDEAHAFTILTADTIDLPIKSSGEFLTEYSKFGEGKSELLANDESYQLILSLATPTQYAVLEGLSEQLGLSGDSRIVDAWRATQSRGPRGGSRRRREPEPGGDLRRKIASDIERQWPELANVLNPVAVDLMTSRSDEFIEAIEEHPDYVRFRALTKKAATDAAKQRVKYERFLRVADNVALAENLKRLGDKKRLGQYETLVKAESSTLTKPPTTD